MDNILYKRFEKLVEKHQHYLDEDTDNWKSCKAVVADEIIGPIVVRNKNLSYSMFEFVQFNQTVFIDVNFRESYFRDCQFDGCGFIGCTFSETFFSDDEFDNCLFTGSVFSLCTFNNCSIRKSAAISDGIAKDLDISPSIYLPISMNNNKFYLCEFISAFAEQTTFVKNTMDDCRFYSCDFGLLKFENRVTKYTDNRSSFRNCNFSTSCENIPDLPLACPSTGSFVAYKKVLAYDGSRIISDITNLSSSQIGNYAIAVLQIPASAKRLSANGTKCRCDKAKVLRFETLDGEKIDNIKDYTFTSIHDPYFDYVVGKMVKPVSPFCEDRWNECSSGIHFFMNREDAVLY